MRFARHHILLAATLLPSLPAFSQAKAAGPAGSNPAIRLCKASDLSLGTDDENGAFNGMSHSGTLLVLRNLSGTPCRVQQRPEISFVDKDRKPLPISLDIPGAKFMHPGPVLIPVLVTADAEVTSKLRWVSADVFDRSVCVEPAFLVLKLQGESQQTAANAHICGDKVAGIHYEATPLAVDPQLRP